jgi:hypothetical protein
MDERIEKGGLARRVRPNNAHRVRIEVELTILGETLITADFGLDQAH